MMTTLTLKALGFTEDDLWREIRDRWRRPAGEPRTEAEMRSLLRAEMIEEQARFDLAARFAWIDANLMDLWVMFRESRLAQGATRQEIVKEWLADSSLSLRLWADAG